MIKTSKTFSETKEMKETEVNTMKTNLKKAAALAMAAAVTASMGSMATVVSADEAADYSGHTLNVGIWGGNDQEAAALEEMKAAFEEKTGAEIVFKTYTDYNTQIQADFIARTAPDVFYVDGSMFPFYAGLGVMEPLDAEEMEAGEYYENLISAFTAEDGTLYCIPKDVSTLATYYNKDILESVGVSAEDIPANLEDYAAFLTDLQAKLDEEYGKGQVAAMTYNPELSRQIYVLEENGASIMDENGMSTMSSDGVVENLQFLIDLVGTGAVKTPADLGLGWNGEAFGVGKAAIMEEGNWVYGTLKTDYSDINFGVKEMPSYCGSQHSMSFTVGYGISAVSEEKELAKEWIKYATGSEGLQIWSNGAGCLPSRPAVAEEMDIESDPVWAVHAAMIDIATPWQRGTTVSIIDSAYKNFNPAAFKGETGAKEAMEQVDSQANSEIENAM